MMKNIRNIIKHVESILRLPVHCENNEKKYTQNYCLRSLLTFSEIS